MTEGEIERDVAGNDSASRYGKRRPRAYIVSSIRVKVPRSPSSFVLSFFSYTAQHQQADDFGIWRARAEGVICGKIGNYVE